MIQDQIVKEFISKKGNSVVIRYLKKQDTADLLKFANDLSREDTFVMLSGEEVSLKEEVKYVSEALKKIRNKTKIQLVAIVNGELAGNAVIDIGRKRKKHSGVVSISIAKPYRDEGIGTVFLNTLIDEARKAGLKLLELTCFENNERACRLYEKIGFQKAGVIPKMYSYHGDYIGEKIYFLPLT